MRFEFKLSLKTLKHVTQKRKMGRMGQEPSLRQSLVLAHQIEDLMTSNQAKSFAMIAGWLNLSEPRINQIANLVFLAPKIQSQILSLDSQTLALVAEYKTRDIIDEVDWDKQLAMWNDLLSKSHLFKKA